MVRIYNHTDAYLFDLELTQICATESPLHILQHPYGGLAIRGNRNWLNPEKSDYLTSEGKTRVNGNHTRPLWADLSGWIDRKMSGITVLEHPDNFRFPQTVRMEDVRPYFCFAPDASGPFTIEGGKPYVSRYRFYIHDGPPEPHANDHAWQDYAHPAQARVVEEG
jgi:hypothetical protein